MNNILLISVFLILFLLGLAIHKKNHYTFTHNGIFTFLAYSSFVVFLLYLISDYFTGDGINEATFFHLKYGLGGAGFLEYIWLIILSACSLLLFTIFILWRKNKSVQNKPATNNLTLHSVMILALCLNPGVIDLYKYNFNTSFFETKNEQHNKTGNTIESTHENNLVGDHSSNKFEDYYKTPSIEKSGFGQKNLIFIQAESLERTYFDDELFPGLVNGLKDLESSSIHFTNIKQVYATGFTIGGLTAIQCGIPLETPSGGNSMSGMDQFLPSATCLGDLLSGDENYHMEFLGGARLSFAGKGKLYRSHGFKTVAGVDELLPYLKNPDYLNYWGLYDDTLFDIAFNRFTELSKVKQKFSLFTLTLDTHHPVGHKTDSCKHIKYKDGSNSMLNSVACSDYLISNFIARVRNSEFAENTLIVLVSDHLAMKNEAYSDLKQGNRKNIFMIIDPAQITPRKINTAGSTLDIATTILPFLGYSGNIGLGRDLLDPTNPESERLKIHAELKNWKKSLKEFWNFPTIQNSITYYKNSNIVEIDKRKFTAPLLIDLDEKMQTELHFGMFSSKPLSIAINDINQNRYFLLFDHCSNYELPEEFLSTPALCLLSGEGKHPLEVILLNKEMSFNKQEIKSLLGMPNGFSAKRVAHAGGGIQGKTYTNSIDALNENIDKGFQYFEIDFSFTLDEELVCLHDWENSFIRSFGHETKIKVTLKDFDKLVKTRSKFQKCTSKTLAEWMAANPTAVIITDVKESNILALKKLLKVLPNAKNRVIPQVYYPENLSPVRELGFEKVIWTLYNYSGSNEDILKTLKDYNHPIAVTMPPGRVQSGLAIELKKMNIPTYVHTINDPNEARAYITEYGVSEIYTDFLPPRKN